MIRIDSLTTACVYNTLANMCPTTVVKEGGREEEGRKREGSLGIVTRNRERGEHFAHAHSHVRESAHISLALLLSQGGLRMGH